MLKQIYIKYSTIRKHHFQETVNTRKTTQNKLSISGGPESVFFDVAVNFETYQEYKKSVVLSLLYMLSIILSDFF